MKKIKAYIGSLSIFLLPVFVFAAGAPTSGVLQNPTKFSTVAEFMNAIFGVLIQLGAVAVTLAIVYSGFLFVAARGNPEELKKAKTTLFWTILGSLVLLGAQVISDIIENSLKTVK